MSSRASIGDYVVTSKLGSGSFAVVYKGYHKTTKVPVAIKAMSLGKLNSKLLANLETEISIMRQIDHPNVVKLYEIKKTEKHIYLILEYCAGGDLQQYMRRQEQKAAGTSATATTSTTSTSTSSIVGAIPAVKRERLSEDVAHHFLKELAKGMMCLWSHNLIHRDLKPQNLLLVEDSPTSALKIADFGFARHLATTSLAETLCGSPLYMAPEILKFQKYDAKADLWSVGTILYEMVVGKPPYGGANHVQLLANIERNDLRFPSNVELSVPCKNLLLGLLQRKPVNRMGFDDFFNHPFVGLRELSQSAMTAMSRSVSRSTATASIREEDEDMDEEHSHLNGTSEAERAAAALPKERTASDSHDSPSPSNSALRHSRSDNIEVMQTVFGSTSSAGSAALRRSSRLGRSRRATSSGAILVNQQTTSPKLSPQMSPHMLPSPSPRINPFKLMAESPPGAAAAMQGSALLRASGGFLQASQRLTRPTTAFTTVPTGTGGGSRLTRGGVGGLDSSDEYVLVDSGTEKAAASPPKAGSHGNYAVQDRAMAVHQTSFPLTPHRASSISDAQLNQKLRSGASFSHEHGQQLIDIVMLRTQAISPIAEQLWKLSCASVSVDEQRDSATGSATNLASMFSMGSSSMSSSSDGQVTVGVSSSSTAFGDEDGNNSMIEKKQYVFAAEALALYVKCLRIIQQGISYLRQDPVLSKRLTSSPPTPPVPWSEASRKLSMAYLTEQLNCFLDRAEQCKKRMSSFVASADAARVEEFHRAVVSQEELLYTHAIRLGKQGAVKEVLGQTSLAYEHYLQSMLLLETLLMDTTAPSIGAAGWSAGVLAVDDQKCVNAFLKALDERLKNVKLVLDEENRGAVEQQQQQQQHPFSHLPVSSPLTSYGPP